MASGDTAQAAWLAGTMYLTVGESIYLWLAPIVAFSRVYYHCHWIGDTIMGCLLGLFYAYITLHLWGLVDTISAPWFGYFF